jgi:alginate O-acetyltransferase complex protein AlgI
MVVTSYGFLLVFLPLVWVVYWRLVWHPRAKLWVLCIASYIFYAFGGISFVLLLLGLSLATFILARWSKIGTGISLNLFALVVFKYLDFGIGNLNALLHIVGLSNVLPLLHLALPLGVSFFVFKHIGYLLDVRAKRYAPTDDFLVFTTYSAFFPQVSAGPISLFNDTGKQLANLPAQLSGDQAYQGLVHISLGLVKKLLIADMLSNALQSGLYAPEAGSGALWAWFSVIVYALQLYFDFSGYTDLALGIGYLLGVTLPPNFDNPYLATSPNQFWQRWHISLSMWFRVYVFFPLSRKLLKRWGVERAQYAANFITMTLVGLWHGAGWGFILWGLYHGLLLNIYAWANRRKIRLEGHLLLLMAVLIGWALFLSPTLVFAGTLFRSLAGLAGIGSLNMYKPDVIVIVLISVYLVWSGVVEAAHLRRYKSPVYTFALGILAVLALLHLGGATRFIYVQF